MGNKESGGSKAGIKMFIEESGVAIYNRSTMIVGGKQVNHGIELFV